MTTTASALVPVPTATEHAPLQVQAFGLTDRGKVRPTNEDQFLIADLTQALRLHGSSFPQPGIRYADERAHLLLVADGMGGHQAGQQASALAVAAIEAFVLDTFRCFGHFEGEAGQEVLAQLQAALRQADQQVIAEGALHPELRGMGTTVTLAYALGSQLFVAHVGSSRCYLLRRGQFRQLTRDHTYTDEMVRHGILTPEEAVGHRFRHLLVNAVGGDKAGVDVEAHRVDLEPGDCLLVCSDGLTDSVPALRIRDILQEEKEPKTACQRLVAEANVHGGKDNVTVIVARLEAPAEGHN
jgi:protein phosphatase